jgi:hypothetical protein
MLLLFEMNLSFCGGGLGVFCFLFFFICSPKKGKKTNNPKFGCFLIFLFVMTIKQDAVYSMDCSALYRRRFGDTENDWKLLITFRELKSAVKKKIISVYWVCNDKSLLT